jgi:HAD superfamily hydrolase (TIGR01509 family)
LKNQPTPRGLVFDMDGLLLDSERLAMAEFEHAITAHGFPFEKRAYLACVGTREEMTRDILVAHYGPELPYDAIVALWSERYHGHVLHRPVAARPGAKALLEFARAHGLPMALATSTRAATAQRKLDLAGFRDYFRFVVGGDQVRAAKPHPEPYLTAAAALDLPPCHCWAFEDSNNGARSALAAGLWVVQVPDLLEPEPGLAHVVVDSLGTATGLLASAVGATISRDR